MTLNSLCYRKDKKRQHPGSGSIWSDHINLLTISLLDQTDKTVRLERLTPWNFHLDFRWNKINDSSSLFPGTYSKLRWIGRLLPFFQNKERSILSGEFCCYYLKAPLEIIIVSPLSFKEVTNYPSIGLFLAEFKDILKLFKYCML